MRPLISFFQIPRTVQATAHQSSSRLSLCVHIQGIFDVAIIGRELANMGKTNNSRRVIKHGSKSNGQDEVRDDFI